MKLNVLLKCGAKIFMILRYIIRKGNDSRANYYYM